MHHKKIIVSILAATCLITAPANADVGAQMQSWFNGMGGFSNTTPPSSYQGQTMNGYSAGGYYQRVPQQSYQLANMTPPSLNIGCGGIDLTAGSFSFINRAQLTAMLKNVGTSIGYGFLIAINTTMPSIGNDLKYLQDMANKINALNVNTCQMTQGVASVVGSAISDAKANGISHTAGTLTGQSTDAFSSWVSTPAQKYSASQALAATDPATKKEISPGNVVWQALGSTNLSVLDKSFIMSMTGTIIIRNQDPTGKPGNWNYYGPTGNTANDFIGYKGVTSQQLQLYSCDTTVDCLNPTVGPVAAVTFLQMVSTSIDSLKNNVVTRATQTTSDFYLVAASSLPVWKMISVSADVHPDLVDSYKRLIAVDIAYSYLQNILATARETLTHEQHGTLAADAEAALKELGAGLDKIKTELYTQRLVEYAAVQKQAEMERELQLLNQTIVAGLPVQAFSSLTAFGTTR